MSSDNKRRLYDALSRDYDMGTYEQFCADLNDETKRRKLYDATSGTYDFGDYNSFQNQLGYGRAQEATPAQPQSASQTTAQTPAARDTSSSAAPVQPTVQAPQQEPFHPSPVQLAHLNHVVESGQRRLQQLFEQGQEALANQAEYYRGQYTPSAFVGGAVKSTPRLNPLTGKIEDTWVTPYGERTFYKGLADYGTRQFREAMDMSVSGQIRKAERELAGLRRQLAESQQRVHDETTEFNETKLTGLGRALIGGQMYTGMQQGDRENAALRVAIRQREEQLKDLREQQDRDNGVDVGFWRGFGRTAGDFRTWDFGLSDLSDAMTMMNADHYTSENATEGERLAGQRMMSAIYDRQQVEQMYGGNASFWNRAGGMAGYMPSFMVDFAITGGGFEAIDVAGKAATRGAVKVIGKEAVKEITEQGVKTYVRNNGAKGAMQVAGNWTIKAMGTTADELLIRAPLMTNTVQMAGTAADIIDRKLGDVEVDEYGNYNFANDRTWGSAVWQGEANSIIENYSEMFGTHLDGVAPVLAKTFGGKRISGMLARANASSYGQILNTTRRQFQRLGVSDYFGEVSEEYYGQLWRSMLNLDDAYTNVPVLDENGQQKVDENGQPMYERKNLLFTGQFHGDIWGGMALSMGLMGAGKYTISGAAYGYMRHGVNVADRRASALFGDEDWEALRTTIDNTTNDDIGNLAEAIVGDNTLTNEQRGAAMEYMERSLNLRGFNLGEVARTRGEADTEAGEPTIISSEQEIDESYLDGYNATSPDEMADARNLYEYQRQRAVEIFGEDGLQNLDNNPINELASLWELDPDNAAVARDYVNASYHYQGMLQGVRDNIDLQIAASDAMIDRHTNKTSGMVHPATMKVDDRQVYIVSGNVVSLDDGFVDRGRSDDDIIICFADNGQLEFTDPSQILSVQEAIDPQQAKEEAANFLRQQMAEEAAAKIDGTLSFEAGEQVTMLDSDGDPEQWEILGPAVDEETGAPIDGYYIISDGFAQILMSGETLQQRANEARQARVADFEAQRAADRAARQAADAEAQRPQYRINDEITLNVDGTPIRGQISAEENEDGLIEVYTEDAINGNRVNQFTREQLDAMQPSVAEAPQAETQADEAPQAEIAPAEPAPIEGAPVPTASEQVPLDENGRPNFRAVEPSIAWDAIVEKTADEGQAQRFAERQVKNAEAEVKKAEKAKEADSTDIDEFIAQDAARQKVIDDAKAALEHWKRIAGEAQRRRSEAESIHREEMRRQAEARAAEEARLRAEREEADRIEREKLNGVPDFAEDTPADARARGFRRVGAGAVYRQQPTAQDDGGFGNEVEPLFRSGSNPVTAKGRIHIGEVDSYQPSHLDGRLNPAHFLNEAQPKKRHEDGGVSTTTANANATNIRPELVTRTEDAFNGAPIVNSRREAVQGNGRLQMLRYLYDRHPEQAAQYKQYLIDHAEDFGVSPEYIASLQRPIATMMLDVDDNEAIRLGNIDDKEMTSGGIERIRPGNALQSMREYVDRNGKKQDMTGTFANLLLRSNDDEATFSQLIDRNGGEVLKWMDRHGFISPTQYSSAYDSRGNLTAEAANDLRQIMYKSIFRDGATQLEEMFNDMPAKAQRAILSTAYRDYDSAFADRMINEIQQSILAFNQLMAYEQFAAATNYNDVRLAVDAWSKQYAMDIVSGDSYIPAEKFSNFALILAAMYKGSTQKNIQATFNALFDAVQGTEADNLFEAGDKTPKSLADAIRKVLNVEYKPIIKNNNGNNGSAVVDNNAETSESGRPGSRGDVADGERTATEERPADGGGRTASDSGQGSDVIEPSFIDAVKALIAKGKEAASKLFAHTFFDVATTPEFMKELGLTGEKFTIRYGVISRHWQKDGSHDLPVDIWEKLPEALQNPFAITKLTKEDGIADGYRLYTTLKNENGEYIVVGVDVKNAGRELEVNAISTIFGRRSDANLTKVEEVIYKAKEITPEQLSLLDRPNPGQYTDTQGLTDGKGTETLPDKQENGEESSATNDVADDTPFTAEEIKAIVGHTIVSKNGTQTIQITGHTDMNGRPMFKGNLNDDKGSKGRFAHSLIRKLLETWEHDIQLPTIETAPTLGEQIAAAEAEVDTNPTDAQKEAGNYKKGHVKVGKFNISIENPAGSERTGTDADGHTWSNKMNNAYGYILGTESADGDHIDVYLSNNIDDWDGQRVIIVDQYNPNNEDGTPGTFDEHKVMLGYNEKTEAINDYLANYEKGWERGRRLVYTSIPIEEFEKWIESSHRKTKPFHEYASVQKATENEVEQAIEATKQGMTREYNRLFEFYSSEMAFAINTPEKLGDVLAHMPNDTLAEKIAAIENAPTLNDALIRFESGVRSGFIKGTEEERELLETLDSLAQIHAAEQMLPAMKEELAKRQINKRTGYTVNEVDVKGKTKQAVVFDERVDKDEFKRQASVARKLGGNYVRGKGFCFDDVATADKFAEAILNPESEAAQDVRPLSLSDVQTGTGISQVNVESLMGALNNNGKANLSDHSTPIDNAPSEPSTPTNPSGNKLVTDERYAELKARMKKKLGGQLNMGVDPEILAIGTEMAVYHIEKGSRKFVQYAKAMIADLGDAIRPYLKSFYNAVRDMPEAEAAGLVTDMDSYDDVRRVDIANFDKATSDAMATAEAAAAEAQAEIEREQAEQSIRDQIKHRQEMYDNLVKQYAARLAKHTPFINSVRNKELDKADIEASSFLHSEIAKDIIAIAESGEYGMFVEQWQINDGERLIGAISTEAMLAVHEQTKNESVRTNADGTTSHDEEVQLSDGGTATVEVTEGYFIPGVRPQVDEPKPSGKKKPGNKKGNKPTKQDDGGLFAGFDEIETPEAPQIDVPQRPEAELAGDSAQYQEREAQTAELVGKIGAEIRKRANLSFKPDIKPMTMLEVKKMSEEYSALADISMTDLQELVELAMTQQTRAIAQEAISRATVQRHNHGEARAAEIEREAYKMIVRLYQMQPSLNARDSERLMKQQYSTPTPFGFLMGQFVQSNGKSVKSMLEPSAGNGALTITLDPSVCHVNDIDQARLANLRKLGYAQVTAQDALAPFSGEDVDAVLTNPPFGTVMEKVYDGIFRISSLEGQMAINALQKMKVDGRAAIVIGGNTSYRTNGSMNPKDAAFFGYLYSHYNVADVINISGKALYSRNGTGYDVRMILIDGRKAGEFHRAFPPVKSKARAEQVTTFDELYQRVQDDIQQIQQMGHQSADVQQEPRPAADGTASAPVRNGSTTTDTRPGREPVATDGNSRPASASANVSTPTIDGGTAASPAQPSRPTGVDNGNGGNATGANDVQRPQAGTAQPSASGAQDNERGGNRGNRPTTTPARSESGRERLSVKPDLTAEKVPYPNQSNNGFTLQSVVPATQAQVLQQSLAEIGDVDQFLVDKLGYSSKEELYHYLAAEQIDSVALAIKQMGMGNAFIIGDMTGVGKGRQGAALIRYAVKQDDVPIYFTQKPTLFTDNYRDLKDIGSGELRPFIISTDPKDANIVDEAGNVVHRLPSAKERERVYDYILENGTLPDEYDYVLCTYSQIQNGTKDYAVNEDGEWAETARKLPKKSKGYTTADYNGQKRRDVLARLAEGNYAILDESHTVGGDSGCGRYMQMLTSQSHGVTFLSATFAKRADNMPIYAQRTAIAAAGVKTQELIDAIMKGGVTLQEIMSKQLVESGQMIRRERDFNGVNIDWLSVAEDVDARQRQQFNEVSEIFNAIRAFQDDYITPLIDKRNEDAAETGATVGHTQGTKDLGVKNVPFASKMYNLVNQLLFALKVDAVADRVIENLRAGYKPVISFTNTMEGFLKEAPQGVEMDEVPNFSITLVRALDGVMRFTEKDADENTEGGRIELSELSPEGRNAYNAIRDRIMNMSANLPISPMDAIRMKIEEAGYSVAEITGRTVQLSKTKDGKYIVQGREDRDKKANMRDFNSGKLDVLMINKSGSTGISLHASSKFEDQRPRVMVFAQFQSDINDEVQMRGRIDRSGQIHRGRYEYIMSTIPAEQRIQMMFKAKLKSLDANTTSSQKSKFNDMEIVDYLNKYGDEVVWEYMKEHPELEERLGDPLDMLSESKDDGPKTSDKENTSKKPDCAAKISRYLAFLSVEEQDEIFRDITEAYRVKIQLLNDAGENDLEITTMPLRAETKSKQIWHEGTAPGSGNAFADHTYVEEVEVDVLKKPMKRAEIDEYTKRLMGEFYSEKNGGRDWDGYVRRQGDVIAEYYRQKVDEAITKLKEQGDKRIAKAREAAIKAAQKARGKGENDFSDEQIAMLGEQAAQEQAEKERLKQEKRQSEINAVRNRINSLMQRFRPGMTLIIPQSLKEATAEMFGQTYGTFIGFKFNKSYTLGSSTAVFATLDGRRKVELALGDGAIETIYQSTNIAVRYSPKEFHAHTMDNWDSNVPTQTRQTRHIITGNILQALVDTEKGDKTKGNLISFSTIDGETRQGILMGENFKPSDLRSSVPLSARLEQIRKGETVVSENGDVSIERVSFGWQHRGDYELKVPKSKQRGGIYTMDGNLLKLVQTGNFITKGNNMVAYIDAENIAKVVDLLSREPFKVTVLQESKLQSTAERAEGSDDDILTRPVTDEATLERLNNEPTIKVYRAMQVIDGGLRPPMSARVGGELREATELGTWEEAEERPELADEKGKFTLNKGNGKSIKAAYNPYIHTSRSPINDQFSSAWSRPELVTVEVEVPESELTDGYRADKAEKPVGEFDWKSGPVGRLLAKVGKARKVILSRWNKPVRVVPVDEVADGYARILAGTDIEVPFNTVNAELREALVARGVRIGAPEKGNAGDASRGAYEEWLNSQSLQREGNGALTDDEVSMENDPWSKAWGESMRTRKQRQQFAERERKRMRERVKTLADKLHLDNVEIVDDAATITGKRAKSKGFYNKRTGKIVVVLSNNISTFDIEKTLLHEAVAHYGLRQMFGKQFDTFLDNVYQAADDGIRRQIADMAAQNGWDFRTATEEYLAELAEDTPFESASRGGFWFKVKELFLKMLEKIGFENFRDTGVVLTDNELRYLLWRSYENLAEPGRYRSILGEAADVAMQDKLQVGEYAEAATESEKAAEGDDLYRDDDFSPRDVALARSMYNSMCRSGANQFREAVQDSMQGLKNLYQAILGRGKRIENVAGYENAYLYENRMSSTNAGEQYEYFGKYMRPLLKAIGDICGKDKWARRELTDYIMAKHGLERNEYMRNEAAANGEDTNRDFAGLTALTGKTNWRDAEDEAQRLVDDYENSHDTTELWVRLNDATKATLEKIYLSGLLSKTQYEKVRDMYQYYIPLRGWDETTSDEVYGYLTSNDGPLMGSVMKKAEGRESKADDPIATIGMMADAAIRQGNRNIMKQRFLNFVLNNPSDAVSVHDLWLQYDDATDTWQPVFADVLPTDSAEDVERKVEAFEANIANLAQAEPDKYKRGRSAVNIPYKVVKGNMREHQIIVKRAGRSYVLTINGNPRAAQALNGLTNPDVETNGIVGNMLKAGEWVNRQLSAFYTTRNPDFVVSNFFRDMLYSNCMAWVKEKPSYAVRFHKNFGRVNPAKMRVLLGKWTNGTLNRSNYIEGLFYDFMRNGGETGYTSVKDIEGHKKTVAEELKKQGSAGRRAWSALGMQLELLNRSAENCARFAAFVTSRELGRSLDRAIYDAKEVSVNFNKKGSGGKMVNAVGQTTLGKIGGYLGGGGRIAYVFWNAGVQGMTNFGRNAKRHPAKFMVGASAMFTLGYVIPLLAQMLGGGDGDDDDKNAYYNLPEYVRRSNICFKAGEQWITIPLPIEFRALYGLGELTSGVVSGNERYSNGEMARQMAAQVSQIFPLDALEGGGGVTPFIPSAVKPFAEAYIMNKAWTGLPVYKDTPYNKNEPEWTKAYASADQHLVSFARWLNETSGGDDFRKGAIDINPAKIEYLLNGTFGGVFTFPMKIKKSAETLFGGREFDWRNMPIANRLVKSGDERTEYRKLQNEYFKYLQEYEETQRLLRKYENAADDGILGYAEKADFLYNSPEYLRYEIFDEYKGDIDGYREDMAAATDEAEKSALRTEMYELMRELIGYLRAPETYIHPEMEEDE